jgi:hypothetical protein
LVKTEAKSIAVIAHGVHVIAHMVPPGIAGTLGLAAAQQNMSIGLRLITINAPLSRKRDAGRRLGGRSTEAGLPPDRPADTAARKVAFENQAR